MKIKDYIKDHILLTDGAMGTYFDQIEKENYICSEEANLVNPELILSIHRSYIQSGARLLRTNTFCAYQSTIEKIREKYPIRYSNLTVKDLVVSGYDLARLAAKEARKEGIEVYVAADIGPVIAHVESEEQEILSEYYEVCDSFLEAGADLFVFETFPDEKYVLQMADYVRKKRPDAYLIGQFSFAPTGYSRTSHFYKSVIEKAAESGLLDAVGFNCGVGAVHMKRFINTLLHEYTFPENVILTALPNCGYPQIVRGHAVYPDSVDYFSDTILELLDLGAGIVGGCCGTEPSYIQKIAEKLEKKNHAYIRIRPRKTHVTANVSKKSKSFVPNTFREKLLCGEKVYAVELDPPFDHQIEKFVDGAKALKGSPAEIITIADSPLARSRADSLLMAAKIKRDVGMDACLTCPVVTAMAYPCAAVF